MLHAIRQTAQLVARGTRLRWVAVLCLAIAVGLAEIAGALLIFLLLRLISSPDASVKFPLIGEVGTTSSSSAGPGFVLAAVGIASFFFIRGGLYLLQSYMQNRVAHNAGVRLSTALLRGYLRMPFAEHARRNSAEMIRNSLSTVQDVVAGVLVPTVAVVSESLIVLGVFAGLLLVAPAATIATAGIMFCIVAGLVKLVQPKLLALGAAHQSVSTASFKAVQQSLQGVKDIKLLGRESYFERRFAAARATQARIAYNRAVLLDAPRAAIESALVALIVAFLLISVRTAESPEALLAVLGVFAYAVLRVLPSVNRIVANISAIRFASAAVNDISSDLRQFARAAADVREQPTSDLRLGDTLRLDSVSFAYEHDAPPVLHGISLTICRGESIGIVGSTGAGKSTLVDVILGLLEPTAGSVRVDGVDIQDNLRAWQSQLGVVPQSIFLTDDTLRRNIALGEEDADIDEGAVLRAVQVAQLGAFVDSAPAKLDTFVGERGVRLSGGQRQRVAIARALYRKPEVLVFDEGTSALDNATEAAFSSSLERLRGECTIITVAHRLSTVRLHDRIVVLNSGRVADVGAYDELLSSSSIFRELAG